MTGSVFDLCIEERFKSNDCSDCKLSAVFEYDILAAFMAGFIAPHRMLLFIILGNDADLDVLCTDCNIIDEDSGDEYEIALSIIRCCDEDTGECDGA